MASPGVTDQSLAPNCYIFSAGTIPGSGSAFATLYSLLAAADQAVVDAWVLPALEVHIFSPTVALNWNHAGSTTVYWPVSAGGEEIVSTVAALKKIFVRSNTASTITDALLKVYA